MRKDVRFGLAIGSVLLAVLIVYVLVVPGESTPGDAMRSDNPTVEQPQPLAVEDTPSVTEPARIDVPVEIDMPVELAAPDEPADPTPGPAPTAVASSAAPVARDNTGGAPDWSQLLAYGQTHQSGATAPALRVSSPAREPRETSAPPVRYGDASGYEDASGYGDASGYEDADAPRMTPSQAPSAPVRGTAVAESSDQAPGTYIVRTGDTLSSIALEAYGSANYYPHIQRANPQLDPRRLRSGMKISLPDRAQVVSDTSRRTSSETSSNPPIDSKRQYQVQGGDSLYRISIQLYGNAQQADKLYELNRQLIGPDPARLKVGMVLQLPETPRIAQGH